MDGRTIASKRLTARAIAASKRWADRASERCYRWYREGSSLALAWGDERELRCNSAADRRYAAFALQTRRLRSRYARVWISSWMRSAWYWTASWASRLGYLLANAIFQTVLVVARSVFVAAVASLRLLTIFVLWIAKLICATWDFSRCLAIEVFAARRRHARKIKHVFVLMMENRSFDHMLGFAGLRGTDAITGQPTRADDLVGKQCSNIDPGNPGTPVIAASPAEAQFFAPYPCPGHEFHDTLVQLCGENAVYPDPATGQYPAIDHSGFVTSYRAKGAPNPSKIMGCYSSEQVPVLTALAREFAVCDRWFSSVPGPTWPNRFFVHAASSAGLDDTPSPLEIATGTLLEGYLRSARRPLPGLAGLHGRPFAAGLRDQRNERRQAPRALSGIRILRSDCERPGSSCFIHIHRAGLRKRAADYCRRFHRRQLAASPRRCQLRREAHQACVRTNPELTSLERKRFGDYLRRTRWLLRSRGAAANGQSG